MIGYAKVAVAIAGWLHFLQLPAMLAARRILSWDDDLSTLTLVNRRLFKVIVAFIMLTVLGLGAVVVRAPGELVAGGRLGRDLCLFLSTFWLARAFIQAAVLAETFPRNSTAARLSARGLVVLFVTLGALYAVGFVGALWV
jgi:hypothetical protein